jgi:glycosyltransferase involved in cell wall biosynthesis
MKRIAYASPVNPAPSGISDYSEELLPYLGQYADVTLYLDDALRPGNEALARAMAVRPLSRLEADQRRQPFDAILYHMGNSPVHAAIWRAMQRVPGVVVLHEIVLHHFMLQIAAAENNIAGYLAEARERYGAEGERIAQLMARGRFTAAAFDLPFSERVLDRAEGLIAHSRYVTERVASMRPGLPVAHVPMGVPLPPLIERAEARARLGLPQDALVLASFGHINPFKRVEAVLRAVQVLRAERADVRYMLVGSVSPNYDLRSLVARMGMENTVQITGYVERAAFEDYVAAADICVNLRHPTAGETSASLLRLLGAGRPTLVTASGSFTELPPGVAAQVDPDRTEGDLILAYCRLLASRPDIAAAMGAQARAYVAREHPLDGAAQGYMRFLSQLYGWGDTPKLRAPLWNLTTYDARRTAHEQGRQGDTATGRQGGTAPSNLPSAICHLPSDAAEALTGIGATEGDHALLRSVAQAVAELAGQKST